jgi:peptide-methionine (R)-S-oxide reductase
MFPIYLIAALLATWNGVKIEKSDEEWRSLLGRERYCVLRRKATEPAYSGYYLTPKNRGTYGCAGCKLALFHSSAQLDPSHGWPSFREPIVQHHIRIKEDLSLPFKRYEVLCRACDGHLGHVFRNANDNTLRYTINSLALELDHD